MLSSDETHEYNNLRFLI